VSGDWLNQNIRETTLSVFFPIAIILCKPNRNFEHGLNVLCIYLLFVAVLSPLPTVSRLLTCVSSPCRHVTSVILL